LVLAGGVGAIYGLLTLEAVSPVGLVVILWAIVMLIFAWRLPIRAPVIGAAAGGLVIGFGLAWAAVLARQLTTCKPPSCVAADPMTDVLYALAFLVPVIALAAGELGIQKWLLRRRLGTRS
jgi:hypothetical protein